MEGKPAAEVERLVKLYNGSPEEQLQFYKEALEEFFSIPFNDFQLKEGDSILDNMHKKYGVARMNANLIDIGENIKKLIEKNPGLDLTLPDRYATTDEMIMDTKVIYDVGCALISPHLLAYQQLPSTKWIHGFTTKEFGNKNRAQFDKALALKGVVDSAPEDKMSLRVISRILSQITVINETHDFDPNGIYNLYTDIEDIYQKSIEKYDNEHF